MKRVGHIFDAVVEPENLRLAFWKASRGKRGKSDCREFAANLDDELERLRLGLIDGTYPIGNYHRFLIQDPKERQISAAEFGERVLHHALMNVCEPYFDRWLIGTTFACRKGKGQVRAVQHAYAMARKFKWFLKCDIRKFFDSIPHEGLKEALSKKIKDPYVLSWLAKIIDTYCTTPGRGLPIGNLTSQHFANLYLSPVDQIVSRFPAGTLGYVRYMDDFVFWSDDKDVLKTLFRGLVSLVEKSLGLQLKETSYLNRTCHGMDFLGVRVFDRTLTPTRRSRHRYERKIRAYERCYWNGVWSEAYLQERATALTAFIKVPQAILGQSRRVSGSNRVQRGGNWNNDNYHNNFPSSNRNNNSPSNRNNNLGVRLCCSAPAAPQGQEPFAVPAIVLSPSHLGANQFIVVRPVASSDRRAGIISSSQAYGDMI